MSRVAALHMTLDYLVKQNNKTGGGGGGGAGRVGGNGYGVAGSVPGLSCCFNIHVANRVTPYSAPKALGAAWSHDIFSSHPSIAYAAQISMAITSSIETGTKLYIFNLDYGVSNEDTKEYDTEDSVLPLQPLLDYTAPELVRSKSSSVGCASDFFSLACVAYHMIARKPLFDCHNKVKMGLVEIPYIAVQTVIH